MTKRTTGTKHAKQLKSCLSVAFLFCFVFFFLIFLSNIWIDISSWEKHKMKILLGALLLICMLQEILSLTDTTHCFITLERGHLDNSCQEVKEMTP